MLHTDTVEITAVLEFLLFTEVLLCFFAVGSLIAKATLILVLLLLVLNASSAFQFCGRLTGVTLGISVRKAP